MMVIPSSKGVGDDSSVNGTKSRIVHSNEGISLATNNH